MPHDVSIPFFNVDRIFVKWSSAVKIALDAHVCRGTTARRYKL